MHRHWTPNKRLNPDARYCFLIAIIAIQELGPDRVGDQAISASIRAMRDPRANPLTRRSFLGSVAGVLAAGVTLPGFTDIPVRRDPRYAKRGFAPFPSLAATGHYGIGTY